MRELKFINRQYYVYNSQYCSDLVTRQIFYKLDKVQTKKSGITTYIKRSDKGMAIVRGILIKKHPYIFNIQ